MAKKKVVDAEEALEGMKNKKFGLSIQNIVAIVTFLSTVIACLLYTSPSPRD